MVIVELPTIMFKKIFGGGSSGSRYEESDNSFEDAYQDLTIAVKSALDSAYQLSFDKVERIIEDGGYDYFYSLNALKDESLESRSYDISYILSAYSVSMQDDAAEEDMLKKINASADHMFPVTYVVRSQTRPIITEDGELTEEEFEYAVCTIHPLEYDTILIAFDIDKEAPYGDSPLTYGQAIDNIAEALRRTLLGG